MYRTPEGKQRRFDTLKRGSDCLKVPVVQYNTDFFKYHAVVRYSLIQHTDIGMYSVYCILKKLKHIGTTVYCTVHTVGAYTYMFGFILCSKYCFSGLVVVVLLYLYTVFV